jgi:hypothetical protein
MQRQVAVNNEGTRGPCPRTRFRLIRPTRPMEGLCFPTLGLIRLGMGDGDNLTSVAMYLSGR